MNKEWKKKWIAALRSGEYKQGRKVLRNSNDEFCCLGVLCDLVVKEGKLEEPVLNTQGRYVYGCHTGLLPALVVQAVELNSREGIYNVGSNSLTHDNDEGKTFLEIADIIEKNF